MGLGASFVPAMNDGALAGIRSSGAFGESYPSCDTGER